jgi:transcriptional regulator with XRE-family HTH domain
MRAVDDGLERVLAGVGERLAALRKDRGTTLGALARRTGISTSTLSRLEAGKRRATLELLLPIAQAHGVTLDELIGTRPADDPRVRAEPLRFEGVVAWPLTRSPGQPSAYKMIFPPDRTEPQPKSHEGYEWLYVLSGRLRLVLGDQDFTMASGEAAEFDTRLPHWIGSAGDGPVEALVLFGRQGERVHLRARSRS